MASLPQPADETRATDFGAILRHWRRARGISQLELASRAGMSARHLSFLETGRCGPSRSSVLQLGRSLELPAPETERLLIVAGHAGDWTRRSTDAVRIREQLGKVSHLLAAHDPFPALLSDPDWHVAFQNRGARALFARMRALAPELCIDPLDLREVLSERILGHLVPNLGDLLRGVLDGLYQLEPDPTCFGHAPSLLDVLPASDGPGHAIERAARSTAWEHPMRLHDGGVELSLELLSLPFAGGASGFALVLARPAGPSDLEPARDYFGRLCAAASDELPAR